MKSTCTIIAAGCALFLLAFVPRQTGTLIGTACTGLDDCAAGAVAGVDVVAWAEGDTLRTVTGRDGRFAFEDVPVGRYQIAARHDGYEPYVLRGVKVASSMTSEVVLLMRDGP